MAGVPADATAQDLMDRYIEHMVPELFKRACHSVLFGQLTAPALDIWGISPSGVIDGAGSAMGGR